ncbi:dihydrodipicolinate synthase family protein [Rhodospirillaceae bacterium KN72]|uniref:Dihydrodipicolinate synthase family protein n=1 Tax=Pacificispira spongiicola TaxID=2729598 RepID=A0A7Y0DWX5_9PROT|nr:dihydrodipicolinate synthase family protein [Pacificispira spongiicola]NMM43107.1 dihydrodipicolinate synthase family protein [Pacificispira spongiicola]
MSTPLALRGLVPACPTPVTPSGTVDRPALHKLVRYMLDGGASGLVPLGGTGEYTAFSQADRIATVETSKDAAGDAPVVAGVLCPGLGDAIGTAADFLAAGADAIMVIVPYYVRTSQQGVIDYFRKIRDTVDIPIVLYDNPARSHMVLQPETIGALAADGTVIGMKASNTDLYHFDHVMQRVGPDFQMLSGYDTLFTQQVSMGARGGVLTSAVIVPGVWNDIQALAEAGRFMDALTLQRKLCPLMDALFAEENPGPTRAALEMIGLANGPSVLPLGAISDGLKARLFKVLQDLYAQGILTITPKQPK